MKNVGNSSRGRSQGFPKIFRAPMYRAHCAVIFAIAQLSCFRLVVGRSSILYMYTYTDVLLRYVKSAKNGRKRQSFCIAALQMQQLRSICLSVCPSHSGIAYKRPKLGSPLLHFTAVSPTNPSIHPSPILQYLDCYTVIASRAFPTAAPKLWNNLPLFAESSCFMISKRRLKS